MSVVVLSTTANASETLMQDTINTGTILIEEGAILPESLRFESEPWTSFYMAGEMIRELRNGRKMTAATKKPRREWRMKAVSTNVPQPCRMRQDSPELGEATTSR